MNPFYDQFKSECLSGEGIDKHNIGPFYKGILYQRGYGLMYDDVCPEHAYGLGLGDNLSNLFQIAWPVIKKGLQYLGKSAVNTAANIAQDTIQGRNVKEAAREHSKRTVRDIIAKAPAAISGDFGIKEEAHDISPVRSDLSVKRKRPISSSYRVAKKRKNQFGKGLKKEFPLLNQY
jgi:hypothetical protein